MPSPVFYPQSKPEFKPTEEQAIKLNFYDWLIACLDEQLERERKMKRL